MKPVTVKQLIKSLKKYNGDLQIYQGGVPIKAVRIWEEPDLVSAEGRVHSTKLVVRLIRQNEKRA